MLMKQLQLGTLILRNLVLCHHLFRLKTILNKHTDDAQEILEAIKILKDTGSIDYARVFAKELVEKVCVFDIISLFDLIVCTGLERSGGCFARWKA